MFGELSLAQSDDGTFDLIIHYSRKEVEFGRDFLDKENLDGSFRSISGYLRHSARGLKVKQAKIIAGTLVLAVVPLHMLLPTMAANTISTQSPGQNESVQMLTSGNPTGTMGEISPILFILSADGSLQPPDAEALDSLRDAGSRVIPTLLIPRSSLSAPRDIKPAANQMIRMIGEYGFDGIRLELDSLDDGTQDTAASLLSLLRELIPPDKELSVAVTANPDGWSLERKSTPDYRKLEPYVGYMVLMVYDAHYQALSPGPVAAISSVEKAVTDALEYMQGEKIVLGIPVHGRLWNNSGTFAGQSIPPEAVEEILETCDPLILYDSSLAAAKAVFILENDSDGPMVNGQALGAGTYELWYDDSRSIAEKQALADRYQLKGTTAWPVRQIESAAMAESPALDEAEAISNPTETKPSSDSDDAGSLSADLSDSGEAISPGAILRQTGSIAAPDAPLLQAPAQGSRELDSLQIGTHVVVLAESEDWCHIQLPTGMDGYLSREDLVLHKTGVVTPKTGVYIFSQPTVGSDIIYSAQSGNPLAILDEYDSGWCKVQLSDRRVGYLPGEYIARTSLDTPIIIKTSAAVLRLRNLPSQTAESYGVIPAGEQLLVLDAAESSEYAKISYGNTVAYVTASYLV